MMKAVSLLLLFCLFSSPGFSQIVVDNSATDNECHCQITCDLDTGYCYDIVGDCDCDWDCYEISPGSWDCDTNCFCYYGAVDAAASAAGAAQQGNQLSYSTTRNNLTQVSNTGMLGTTNGTYADSQNVYVLDEKTLHTNEIHITPAWCR